MSENTEKSIPDSPETDRDLLPHLPFLVQDLWSLGSDVEGICTAARSFGLNSKETVILDTGCGKGAVSITLARRFGFRALGIDACDPLLDAAREKAREYGVENLCRFENHDIREYTRKEHSFDIVVFASMGGLFGTFRETAAILNRQVRKGGFCIIDDGYLKKGNKLDRKHYRHYRNHEETIRELTASGGTVIKELSTAEATEKINAEYLEVITRRGSELAHEKPALKKHIELFIKSQEEDCGIIDEYIEGALWVLQKPE